MPANHPDRVLRILSTATAIAFYGLLGGAALVLIGAPALKLAAVDDPDWYWGMAVPVVVTDTDATVVDAWGNARLEIEDARGSLRLPIASIPWWLFALLWTHAAAAAGLLLLCLHLLRRIFRSVRDGAPFGVGNALRLRWLGVLLLALALLNGLAGFAASLAVRHGLAGGGIRVPVALPIDGRLVLMALVVMALAEVFRRGAELEDEQALVI